MAFLQEWGASFGGQAANILNKASDTLSTHASKAKSAVSQTLNQYVIGATHSFEDIGHGAHTVSEIALIAEGAFGAVIKVRDSRTGQEYALKKMACAENCSVAMDLEAAKLEAKILRDIPSHPNIVRCLGSLCQESSASVCILLEILDGGTLADYMERKQQLSPSDMLRPFGQIAEAVRHLHSQRPPLQHRDLKIENVLLDRPGGELDGSWKLVDFGSCSTECVGATEMSRPQLMKLQDQIDKTVTMLYRPPEMADVGLNCRKGYEITEKVDMWMMGCIIYTLAFFKHPFQDNCTTMAIANARYLVPQDHPMARSAKLCSLIHWLLSSDPSQRPDAAKLCEVLRVLPKCEFATLLDSMPSSVQDKIERERKLYGGKKKTEEPNLTNATLTSKAPEREPRDTPHARGRDDRNARDERREVPQASRDARARAPSGERSLDFGDSSRAHATPVASVAGPTSNEEFDLSFALAPSPQEAPAASFAPQAHAQVAPRPAPQPAPAQAPQLASGDLLGFGFSPQLAPAPAPLVSDSDLLDFCGSAQPQPAVVPSAAGDWCDFTSFATPPSIPATQPTRAQQHAGQTQAQVAQMHPAAPGAGPDWSADFDSFLSAPAASPPPAAPQQRAGGQAASVNLLDF